MDYRGSKHVVVAAGLRVVVAVGQGADLGDGVGAARGIHLAFVGLRAGEAVTHDVSDHFRAFVVLRPPGHSGPRAGRHGRRARPRP